MRLITQIKKADFSKKTEIWNNAELMGWEAEEAVKEMILSLPGCYKIHDRHYGTNLVDAVYEVYGWMPSMLINESLLLGMQATNPKKVYASFTLGLDAVEVRK